jgi:hypothetical protein
LAVKKLTMIRWVSWIVSGDVPVEPEVDDQLLGRAGHAAEVGVGGDDMRLVDRHGHGLLGLGFIGHRAAPLTKGGRTRTTVTNGMTTLRTSCWESSECIHRTGGKPRETSFLGHFRR